MSMKTLEKAILAEIIEVTGRRKLKLKDLMEWSTSKDTVYKNVRETETVIHCPKIGCWAAITTEKKKE